VTIQHEYQRATIKLDKRLGHLKKLSEVEGKERYRVEISNRFAALENVDTEGDVNEA
jgi:hypothetical protein